MMGCMKTPPKAFYPALMELPELAPERRAALLSEMSARMVESARRATAAAGTLLPPGPHGHRTMQESATKARQALAEYSGAVVAHQALADGEAPREIALAWYRGEMALRAPPSALASTAGQIPGLGAGHLLAMIFLTGFAIAALSMHVARRRRTRALLAQFRLTAPSAPAQSLDGENAERVATATRVPASVTGNWTGRLRVARVFDEIPGVKTFRLAALAGTELPFMFEPGQFLAIAVPAGARRLLRSYSIASSPCCHGWCDVTVKHVPGGTVSSYLHERVKAGDVLDVSGPYGRFTFTGQEASRLVLVAGGIGITPLMSAIRYLTDQSWSGDIYLIYGATRLDNVVFRSELAHLAQRHPNLHSTFVLSDEPSREWHGPRGHVTAEVLAQAVPDIEHTRIHLCGPPPMMEAVKTALAGLGVPPGNVHTELFLGPDAGPLPRAEDVAGTAALCQFARSGKSASLAGNITVLEAAEAAGVPLQYACRQGYCGVCKVKLLAGTVTMAIEDGLAAGDRAAGLILSCQARAAADITVDA